MPRKIVVIGGGAAGMFAAIHCAEINPKLQVTVLEAGKELLSKVKISGGGRCNVTHHCFEVAELVTNYPRGSQALQGAFSRFQAEDTVNWFAARGVKLKTEADGRMFPTTDNSQTIIDCLIKSATVGGVRLLTTTVVKEVRRDNQGGFSIVLKNGETMKSDLLLLATGSHPSGYRLAANLGHEIQSPIPSLFTFKISDRRLENLAGVSVKNATLSLGNCKSKHLTQTGPLLITHWGLSGPSVLKLSAFAATILAKNNYQMPLVINWLPPENPESLRQKLLALKSATPKKQLESYSPLGLPKRLWQRFLELSGIKSKTTWAQLPNSGLHYLTFELTQGLFHIQGKGIFKEEFVTCGGVNLKQVQFKTMESKICPGLYFAGEILDIDGITGGFNFQNAWTTGWLAGEAMAQLF